MLKKHYPYNVCVWGDLGWMLEKGGWLGTGTGSPGPWSWHQAGTRVQGVFAPCSQAHRDCWAVL